MYTVPRGRPAAVQSGYPHQPGLATLRIWKIDELTETMRLTALCGLGHSTAVPVQTSIQNFRKEYLAHIDRDTARSVHRQLWRKAFMKQKKIIETMGTAG